MNKLQPIPFRLGCELSDKVAAIGPVAGAMPEPLMASCAPARPVSVKTHGRS